MKLITLFYLKTCPYCLKALSYIDELKKKAAYANVEIEMIEEEEQAELANQYNYYYVPTFYIDNVKVHEGAATYEEVETVFKMAL